MAGLDDILPLFRFLGLPATLPLQQAQAEQNRAMYEGAGFTPQQLQTAFPDALFRGQFPGAHAPLGIGGFIRGVGQTGQLLQYILGDAPNAPRPPEMLSQMLLINNMQRKARQDKARQDYEAAHPEEKPALEAGGSIDAAERRLRPAGGGKLAQFQKENPGATLADFERFEQGFRKQPQTEEEKGDPFREGRLQAIADGVITDPKIKPEQAKKMLDEAASRQGQKSGARATAGAEVKEKYAHLPVAAQNTMASISTLRGIAEDVRGLLADPAVRADRGLFEGRLRQRLYELGVASDDPKEDTYIALSNFLSILGVQPFMRGTRNMLFIRQIQLHLPKPGDEPELVERKIDRILKNADLLEAGIQQAARLRVNPQTPTPGTAPPPVAQPPPTGGTDDLRQQHPEWFVQ